MDVAEHLVLRVVPVEDFVLEIGAGAGQRRRVRSPRAVSEISDGEVESAAEREGVPEPPEVLLERRLVEADPQRSVAVVSGG
jgi:hypothetical protein